MATLIPTSLVTATCRLHFLFVFHIFTYLFANFWATTAKFCIGTHDTPMHQPMHGFETRPSNMAGDWEMLILQLFKTCFDTCSQWCNSQTTNGCTDRYNTNRSHYLVNSMVSNCFTAVRGVQIRSRIYVCSGTFYFSSSNRHLGIL